MAKLNQRRALDDGEAGLAREFLFGLLSFVLLSLTWRTGPKHGFSVLGFVAEFTLRSPFDMLST